MKYEIIYIKKISRNFISWKLYPSHNNNIMGHANKVCFHEGDCGAFILLARFENIFLEPNENTKIQNLDELKACLIVT